MTTKIGPISLDGLRLFSYSDYGATLGGWLNSAEKFEELKELFALCRDGVAIQAMPGRRPTGYDHTEDSRNTQYCQFEAQEISKLKDGWYLLAGFDYSAEGRVPVFQFSLTLFFLGTEAHYQPGYKMKGLEKLDNDWNI